MRRKRWVPEVLWRLFRDRARTLSDTIISLLPPPPPSPDLCRCKGRHCLGCIRDPRSFLLRPDDPFDYRKLLTKCFIVVSDNAPSLPFFIPYCHWSQTQIVKRTIELMLCEREPVSCNVLCSGYDKSNCSSPTVELLSCSSWGLLLSRVGDDLMVYLLRYTSIFLPATHGKHHQVGGPPISRLCFEMFKHSKFDYRHPSLYECGAQKKRKRADIDDITVEKQKCHISYSTNDSIGFPSGLVLTGGKSSMPLIWHHGSRNNDISDTEVPKSTRSGTVIWKAESEGKQRSNCTATLGKRSRPFSWQRHRCRKKKQLTFEENSINTHCNKLPTNTDCLHASFQCEETSLSYHDKLQMLRQCSCCLILQSLPTVPKKTDVNRQSIFYNLESSLSVLPKKHILYSLRPNLACSKYLIGNIFGFSDVNASAQPMPCYHSSGSCLIGSACLYHSLVRWFKNLIRRTLCCQHTKLLVKHCVSSLDQHTIGRSSSRLKNNLSGTRVQEKSQEFGTKHSADTVEAIDSQYEAVKSFCSCSRSQVVSFIWAVSRSLLPSELLGQAAWHNERCATER